MVKSIFIDYTGTIIQEKGEDLEKIVFKKPKSGVDRTEEMDYY